MSQQCTGDCSALSRASCPLTVSPQGPPTSHINPNEAVYSLQPLEKSTKYQQRSHDTNSSGSIVPERTKRNTSKPKALPRTVIERHYRENLNNQIEHLRKVVPQLGMVAEIEDLGMSGQKPSKGMILALGRNHLNNLNAKNQERKLANELAKERIKTLRKLVDCEGCPVVDLAIEFENMSSGSNNVMLNTDIMSTDA